MPNTDTIAIMAAVLYAPTLNQQLAHSDANARRSNMQRAVDSAAALYALAADQPVIEPTAPEPAAETQRAETANRGKRKED